jgi:hypothetical protein
MSHKPITVIGFLDTLRRHAALIAALLRHTSCTPIADHRAQRAGDKMTIKISPNEKGNPPGRLADVELHFDAADGVLEGLKLIGFGIWERRTSAGRNVTFPARQYSVNGERRSFALLRPVLDTAAQDRIRDMVLQAYAEDETRTQGAL